MSHDNQTTLTGEVTDIFAHRFVVKTATGTVLADIGSKGAEQVRLKKGERVELAGEMKPSELKVHRIAKAGEQPITIEHGKLRPDEHNKPKPHSDHGPGEHEHADPTPALRMAEANGFTVLGVPRRKPKHFEILGRDKAGDLVELHVDLDGTLRKSKPVDEDDVKWKAEIAQAA